MAACKYCKAKVKFIQTIEETPAGPMLRWISINPRTKVRHTCKKTKSRADRRRLWWIE